MLTVTTDNKIYTSLGLPVDCVICPCNPPYCIPGCLGCCVSVGGAASSFFITTSGFTGIFADLNGTFTLNYVGGCSWRSIQFWDLTLTEVIEGSLRLALTGKTENTVVNYINNTFNCLVNNTFSFKTTTTSRIEKPHTLSKSHFIIDSFSGGPDTIDVNVLTELTTGCCSDDKCITVCPSCPIMPTKWSFIIGGLLYPYDVFNGSWTVFYVCTTSSGLDPNSADCSDCQYIYKDSIVTWTLQLAAIKIEDKEVVFWVLTGSTNDVSIQYATPNDNFCCACENNLTRTIPGFIWGCGFSGTQCGWLGNNITNTGTGSIGMLQLYLNYACNPPLEHTELDWGLNYINPILTSDFLITNNFIRCSGKYTGTILPGEHCEPFMVYLDPNSLIGQIIGTIPIEYIGQTPQQICTDLLSNDTSCDIIPVCDTFMEFDPTVTQNTTLNPGDCIQYTAPWCDCCVCLSGASTSYNLTVPLTGDPNADKFAGNFICKSALQINTNISSCAWTTYDISVVPQILLWTLINNGSCDKPLWQLISGDKSLIYESTSDSTGFSCLPGGSFTNTSHLSKGFNPTLTVDMGPCGPITNCVTCKCNCPYCATYSTDGWTLNVPYTGDPCVDLNLAGVFTLQIDPNDSCHWTTGFTIGTTPLWDFRIDGTLTSTLTGNDGTNILVYTILNQDCSDDFNLINLITDRTTCISAPSIVSLTGNTCTICCCENEKIPDLLYMIGINYSSGNGICPGIENAIIELRFTPGGGLDISGPTGQDAWIGTAGAYQFCLTCDSNLTNNINTTNFIGFCSIDGYEIIGFPGAGGPSTCNPIYWQMGNLGAGDPLCECENTSVSYAMIIYEPM